MRTPTICRAVVLFSMLFLASAAPAFADTIDQGYAGPPIMNISANYPSGLAQTFTAGLNGMLTGIGLQITVGFAPLTVSLVNTVPPGTGSPNFADPGPMILGSTMLSPGTYNLSNLITFPQAIAIVAGTTYAIILQPGVTQPQPGSVFGTLTWAYGGPPDGLSTINFSGGQAMIGNTTCGIDVDGNQVNCNTQWFAIVGGAPSAYIFQTHVNAVPEPGTLLLLGTGLAGLGAALRRKLLKPGKQ